MQRPQLFAKNELAVTISADGASVVIDCRLRDGTSMAIPVPTTDLVAFGVRDTRALDVRYEIPSGLSPVGSPHWIVLVFAHDKPWIFGPFTAADAAALSIAFGRWRSEHPIDREPVDVTEEELAASPARFHLRRIRVTGTWYTAFESSRFAGAWLHTDYAPDPGVYRVRVVGTWIYPDPSADGGHGHFGLYPGELRPEAVDILQAPPAGPRPDGLTGLPTRMTVDGSFNRAKLAALDAGYPLSFALLNIDHLNKHNDANGYEFGDAVIRRFAKTVATCMRPGDVVGRWSGDQLAIVLPDATRSVAFDLVERALQAVRVNSVHACTFSAGIVEAGPDERLSQVVERATRLVLDAKAAGRNRVVLG